MRFLEIAFIRGIGVHAYVLRKLVNSGMLFSYNFKKEDYL